MRLLAALFALGAFVATLCAGGFAAWFVWFDGGALSAFAALASIGAASAFGAWAEYMAELSN